MNPNSIYMDHTKMISDKISTIEITFETLQPTNITFIVGGESLSINWGDGLHEEFKNSQHVKINILGEVEYTKPCCHGYKPGIYTIIITGTKITRFTVRDVKLKSIRFIDCDELGWINCINCGLEMIDLDVPSLLYLNCSCNALTMIDLSRCVNLIIIECICNQLTQLDLNKCPKLHHVICDYNSLEKINVLSEKLHHVSCCYNNMSVDELEILFYYVTLFDSGGGDINYALNPGSRRANTLLLERAHWEIKNIYTEKIHERIIADLERKG